MQQTSLTHSHGKYDNNGKGGYLRFDDDNNMSCNIFMFGLHSVITFHPKSNLIDHFAVSLSMQHESDGYEIYYFVTQNVFVMTYAN